MIGEKINVAVLFDYQIVFGDPSDLVSAVLHDAKEINGGLITVNCINPHSWYIGLRENRFKSALIGSTYLLPDGIGIVIALRMLGYKIFDRITGYDFFTELSSSINSSSGSVFFLGGTHLVLSDVVRKYSDQYPSINIAGSYSPPFSEVFARKEVEKMVALINESRPDVVWIGLGAPKQELLILELSNRLNCRVIAGIGAVFDFYAGRILRPKSTYGEWFIRLIQEPRRLYRRTFISAPAFVFYAAKYILKIKIRRLMNDFI